MEREQGKRSQSKWLFPLKAPCKDWCDRKRWESKVNGEILLNQALLSLGNLSFPLLASSSARFATLAPFAPSAENGTLQRVAAFFLPQSRSARVVPVRSGLHHIGQVHFAAISLALALSAAASGATFGPITPGTQN